MSGVNSKCKSKMVGSQHEFSMVLRSSTGTMPSIFERNINCFDDIFKHLSLKDLKALRLTCKAMKEVVNYFIQLKYPRALQQIYMNEDRLEHFRRTKAEGFELVNHMEFNYKEFSLTQVKGIKRILGQIECMKLNQSDLPNCDFYENFLKYCTRLKHLMLRGSSISMLVGNQNKWLERHYPTLEHIGILEGHSERGGTEIIELKAFFEENTNVRIFSTGLSFIWKNRDWMLRSNIKLDRLDIWYDDTPDVGRVCDLLIKLHDKGFYQRLHVYGSYDCDKSIFPRITSLPALERLSIGENWSAATCLSSLEEAHILGGGLGGSSRDDLEMLAGSLTNVRWIYYFGYDKDDILPFIRRCPKLKQITFNAGPSSSAVIPTFDLLALNNERKKLVGAQKTTIFVPEYRFLHNKKVNLINSSLVKLKRKLKWKETNLFMESKYFLF